MALKDYGWAPPKSESNKAFFKDFTPAKLQALDDNTRILFVSDDLLVVYHTKQQGEDWHTATRQLEAFFVNAKDGKLANVARWPSGLRKSSFDLLDSESRIIVLHDGRFLVLANGTMMLYGSDLKLIKQKKLEPLDSTNLWAVQTVAAGREIFLRHESSLPLRVTYQWLDSDTFRVLSEMPGYQDHDFLVQAGVVAGENAVFFGGRSGIRMIRTDQPAKVICDDQVCRGDGLPYALAAGSLGFSGRTGIAVVDEDRGLVWSNTIPPQYSPNDFQFGRIRSAISGKRFAVWITAYHKTLLDGVEIRSSPTVFVYYVTNPKHVFALPLKSWGGDFDFALSPDGTELAIFDGARITLHLIN
ncbi:MAG TPA: hypothetical protein VGR84_12020 [Candidatus Acidoferrales bacterium]|nr:hypothetical protein [Candidatus Acidoferrales bacterium]